MNLKRKLLHFTANIKFNKTCIIENIIPKYAAIKIPGNTMASIITKQQVYLRVQNEIKLLYKKKQQLNKELYISHLYNAKYWQNTWIHIKQDITTKLHLEIEKKMKNKKLHSIKRASNKENNVLKPKLNIQFHTRFVNKSNIAISKSERTLLEKCLKYNLHHKDKQWINRLALEADSEISLVNPLQQNFLKHLVAKHIQKLKYKYPTKKL
jgi:hypothetical protein